MLTALERIRDLSKYYPIFIAGYETREGESILKEIDPARDRDPALVRLREEAGIRPPPGRFFVRFYRTREAIPPGIEHLFRDENVAGVTFFPRYIAVPALDPEAWQESLERSQTIQATISHELVHAYVNCLAGYRVADLPTWYLEGVAIYFSNSSGSRIVVTSQGDLRVSPTEEYETYGLVFKHLEDRLGRSAFLNLIRRSLETVDASLLYREAGFSSYEELAGSAVAWDSQQSRQPLLYALAILAGIALIGAAFYYVPRLFVAQRTSHRSVVNENLDGDDG
jgi:hypothetical protein